MSVKFNGEVLAMQVKSKKIKERGEGGLTYETVVKVGRITIEFDGDSVDVAALAEIVHGRAITLVADEMQRGFPGLQS